MRRLFDKKIFLDLLQELEHMRKINSVKKQFYIFNLQYFGKLARLSDWRRKVDIRTTQTLKFMNLTRILRIIRYDPSQYMNQQKIDTIAKGERTDSEQLYPDLKTYKEGKPAAMPASGDNARQKYI